MLVNPDDGAIYDRVFEIRIGGQALENLLEDAALGPAAKAAEHGVPASEQRGQVAPRRACPHNPENRFEEQAVVRRGSPGIAGFTWQKRANPLPLRVAQQHPVQGWPPFSSLESLFAMKENPF
jgi:hypothetical protein